MRHLSAKTIMTTIEEVNEKIMAIENKIEAIETTLGFEQGKDLLTSLYTNLAELRKEKNAPLGQTGNCNDFVTWRWDIESLVEVQKIRF